MGKLAPLHVVTLFASAMFLVLPGTGAAQDSPLYSNREYRFAVIFPEAPMAREISYTTRSGASVPAQQFYVEQGADRYTVTAIDFPNGPPIDAQSVEHAAEQLRQRGEVRFQYDFNYDPGVPGRQLNIFETNGRQLRASVYMWDHRLFITEASTAPGTLAALQFEQSITLLDATGDEVNTGRGN